MNKIKALIEAGDDEVFCTGCGASGQRIFRDHNISCCPERKIIHTKLSEARADIKSLYEAAEKMAEALRDCRKELWDEWHSSMSENQFNSDPTIDNIDQALTQYNTLKTKKD